MALLSPPAFLPRQEWLMGPQGPSLRGGRPQPKITAVNLLGENSCDATCMVCNVTLNVQPSHPLLQENHDIKVDISKKWTPVRNVRAKCNVQAVSRNAQPRP